MLETLCVLAALVLGGGVVFLVLRQQAKQHERRQASFEARGWTYERSPERTVLWRATGQSELGGSWTLEVRRGRGQNSKSSTVWQSASGAADGAVLLGPSLPGVGKVPLSSPLVQRVLELILGDIARALSDATEVQVGGAAFQEHFSVLASSPELAAEVLSGPAELALVEWCSTRPRGHHPVVMCWRAGLTLRITGLLPGDEDLLALVELGELILAAR